MEAYDGPAWRLMATPLSAPFQGFARRSGIQVFRLYCTPSPVTKSQCRFVMVRVSPSPPYNAGRARTRRGGVDWMCTLHAVSVLCLWCRHQTRISRGGLKRGRSAFYYSVCSVCMTSFLSPSLLSFHSCVWCRSEMPLYRRKIYSLLLLTSAPSPSAPHICTLTSKTW